jgi:methyl-accepting chemotaxis protein
LQTYKKVCGKRKNMKIKSKKIIFVIAIIDIAAVVILISLILNCPDECKNYIDNATLREINENNEHTAKIKVPFINNDEIADVPNYLTANNVIQRVLENTKKTNVKIALMAVYSNDGTILAHFRPERIGKNVLDVDVELSDCMQDIFEAIKNRKIYEGQKYDPLLNDNVMFIVKPLQIGNLNNNLSLLIGVPESCILREIDAIIRHF